MLIPGNTPTDRNLAFMSSKRDRCEDVYILEGKHAHLHHVDRLMHSNTVCKHYQCHLSKMGPHHMPVVIMSTRSLGLLSLRFLQLGSVPNFSLHLGGQVTEPPIMHRLAGVYTIWVYDLDSAAMQAVVPKLKPFA